MELTHHGVKGMKWGVRKDRSSSRVSVGKGKYLKGRRTATELTNEELTKAIRRIELEKRYTQLTTPEKKNSYVKDMMINNSKKLASDYTAAFMKDQIEQFMKRRAGA